MAKPKMITSNWSNQHKNHYDHCQYWMKSETGMSFELGAKGLEIARSLEPTGKLDIQEMNVKKCKTVNLVTNTLGWSRGMLSVNERSYVIRHVLTLRIFGTSKKLCFRRNRERVFNRLNSTNWVKLHKSHVQGSRVGGMRVAQGDLHLQIGGV